MTNTTKVLAPKLSDRQLLTMLLQDVVRRKGTDYFEMAGELLEHFGSLAKVIHASADQLSKLNIFTANEIVKFEVYGALHSFVMQDRVELPFPLGDSAAFRRLVNSVFYFESKEVMYIFAVAGSNVVKKIRLADGDEMHATTTIHEIRSCLKNIQGCTGFILAHNHPDGCARYSIQDLDATADICREFNKTGFPLFGHVIYARGKIINISLERAILEQCIGFADMKNDQNK